MERPIRVAVNISPATTMPRDAVHGCASSRPGPPGRGHCPRSHRCADNFFFAPAPGTCGDAPSGATRAALAALYCALVTDVCLDLIEARGAVTIDGPFARNGLYLGALAALRWPDPVSASLVTDGPTLGAAMIAKAVSP